MSITNLVISLVDKLNLQKMFIESNEKVSVRLISFNSKNLEKTVDQIFKSNGNLIQRAN